tara:strand:- start:529 stop:855 length:327 start_codon:yes stop_codon:yes gene_type:complete
MAYNVTWVLTRPNAETALPTIESISSANKAASDTALSDAGITKGYTVEGLVTKVIFTAPDKATYDSTQSTVDSLVDESTVRSTYKSQLQAAGITCVITDSEGTELANF